MAHYGGEEGVAIIVGDRAEFGNDMYVSTDFFTVFGQTASAGRLFTDRDVPTGGAPPTVAVVAYQWAESHFGSAEAAIGKTITDYGIQLRIVGVARAWISLSRRHGYLVAVAHESLEPQRIGLPRRRETQAGVDLAQAKAQMQAIGDNLARQYPENRFKTVALIPLQDRLTGDVKVMLWLLLGAVVVVLLIACANIANLQLARSAARTREIALRAALGAGRGRVMRQLLTESCVLRGWRRALVSSLHLTRRRTHCFVARGSAPTRRSRIDRTVLLFAVGLSLSSTLLFGLAPAINASRLDLSEALKRGGSKGDVRGRALDSARVRRGRSRPVRHLTGGRRVAAAIVSGAPAGGSRVHDGARARGLYPVPGRKR